MDQLIAFGGGALNESNTRSMLGTIDRGHVVRILDALASQDGPGLLGHVRDLDRDAPDYDRALIEMAAFLQRIAIVQVVPAAALEDEEFDADTLTRMAKSMSPEDVQLYYQIALGARRDLAMAPEPRVGFEMSLLRMLAFRPEAASVAGPAAAVPSAGVARASLASAQSGGAASIAGASGRASAAGPASAAAASASSKPTTIDASSWPQVVDGAGLTGMVRQLALNCVPISFEKDVLILHLDQAASHGRSRQIEDKLVQFLSQYMGREIRVVFESTESSLITPARRRTMVEQDKTLRAVTAFEQDATVKALRERFGADVDTASVKPIPN